LPFDEAGGGGDDLGRVVLSSSKALPHTIVAARVCMFQLSSLPLPCASL